MSAVNNFFEFSKLAQASYALFSDNHTSSSVRDALIVQGGGDFTTSQANNFVGLDDNGALISGQGYSLRNHLPDTIFNGGFSASVFESNANPGKYTLAIRGTAGFFGDILEADFLGIALQGLAREQAISLYRYYKQLITPAGQAVDYSTGELLMLAGLKAGSFSPLTTTAAYLALAVQTSLDRGLGIIPPSAAIDVTGHSLGGHLAVLFTQMVPTSAINHVYTYNGPGIGGIPAEVKNWFGLTESNIPSDKITNIVAEGGLSATAGLGTTFGDTQNVFIENRPFAPIHNHSIVNLTDSLALYDLFAKLDSALNTADPKIGINKVTEILSAASNTASDTLEKTLDSLRRLFLGNAVNPTMIAVTKDDQTQRNGYYTNLFNLRDNLPSGNFQLISLVGVSASSVANSAIDLIAYRYALHELNPFVITGADYSQFNQNGALDLFNFATGNGELTQKYLTDRAQFLTQKISFNISDGALVPRGNTFYQDLASGLELRPADIKQKYVFGGDGNDAPQFSAGNDHIYGGAGDDDISGGGGNDYLEGNVGNDQLFGDEGNDTLVGGTGDGVLNGGDGNDSMAGDNGGTDPSGVADFMDGGAGNDLLLGQGGDDTLQGSDGSDTLIGGDGNDLLDGGDWKKVSVVGEAMLYAMKRRLNLLQPLGW